MLCGYAARFVDMIKMRSILKSFQKMNGFLFLFKTNLDRIDRINRILLAFGLKQNVKLNRLRRGALYFAIDKEIGLMINFGPSGVEVDRKYRPFRAEA